MKSPAPTNSKELSMNQHNKDQLKAMIGDAFGMIALMGIIYFMMMWRGI
jgi:hypothetical protein